MNSDSLGIRITEQQRDRALAYLQQAYADGRLDESSFEERLGKALAATTRRELDKAFSGLAATPLAVAAVRTRRTVAKRAPDVVFGLMHLSPLVSLVVGPAVAYGVSEKGSPMRAEAAKSLNFNLWIALGAVLTLLFSPHVAITAILLTGFGLTWLISTLVNGIKAMGGQPVSYPLQRMRILPIEQRGRR
ncbi:MAG: DUF1707 and DUF4870 domain-containing protein [Propionibacteriaceae bacterium]|nr:DUF1707 and DUF4870 domain-containing protein [Propionibacteriaceae bacterium]